MYEFKPEMREISGFGGSYEEACRKMLKAALEWGDKNPKKKPRFKGYKYVFGICLSNNRAAKKLEKAILNVSHDITGAMFQGVINSYFWIKRHGWDTYVKEMSKKKEEVMD